MVSFFQGFSISAALIIAIGAQNSFVLSHGIKKQYVILIPLICSFCDILLIAAGAAGVGTFVASHPQMGYYAGIGGATFLFWYGFKALHSSLVSTKAIITEIPKTSISSITLATLAISLLNPHVYLDTLVMLGSISGQFEGKARIAFTIGASTASICWFFALSLGGTLLEPLFRHPTSWKILDFSICIVMWVMAFSIWPAVQP